MVLPPLTFIVDPTINLMSVSYHECERREYHFPYSENTKKLLVECIALIVIYLNKISLFLLKIYNTNIADFPIS